MSNPNPSNLKSEALAILREIPHTFVSLANSDNRAKRDHFLTSLRTTHRQIAESFGEPRPVNIGVTSIADDLTRWVALWTWHPHGARWVADLRHHLHVASDTAHSAHGFRWIGKRDAVCPTCLGFGCLEYQETTWDHRCIATDQRWTWKEYRDAVRTAISRAA